MQTVANPRQATCTNTEIRKTDYTGDTFWYLEILNWSERMDQKNGGITGRLCNRAYWPCMTSKPMFLHDLS